MLSEISRSTSEEIPLPISQHQYMMPTSSLSDKHSVSTPNDMAFLNRDIVRFNMRKSLKYFILLVT